MSAPTTTINPHHELADNDMADLKRRVTNFIWQSRRPALQRVNVEVDRGVVTLSGTMPSFHTRQLCLSFCQRVAGVVRVIDKMEVDWEQPTGI